MTVATAHEHLTSPGLASRSFAVIGSGSLATELAQQLESLRAGRIDLYGRAVSPEPGSGTRYRMAHGEDGRALTLQDVARYDTVFVTDEDGTTVGHLNELCLLTGVRFVVVGTHGAALTVGIYPFDAADDAACHTCNGSEAFRSNARAGRGDALTHRIAAGFALTLGLPEAMPGLPVSRRLVGSSLQGRVQTIDVLREHGCSVCSDAPGPIRIVRTRNCWGSPAGLADLGREILEQVVRVSDAIITGVTCSACGVLTAEQSTQYVNRRALETADDQAACPVCARTGSLQFSSRRDFTLAELAERFGNGPAPVRYALARLAGTVVCFDLDDGVDRRPAHWPLVAGAAIISKRSAK
jgi:hypothetical protein